MDHIQEKEVAYKLLGILQAYAPDGPAQLRCTDAFNEMQVDGCTPREMVRMLSGSLNDGLAHGNWPWTVDIVGRY